MDAEEIRKMSTGSVNGDPQVSMNAILRELTAQVAEMNERGRARAHAKHPKQPKQMASAARPNGKKFYNHMWSMSVGEDMLNHFTPDQGQKWPGELELQESSTGTCGTAKDVKITRTQ